MSHVHQRLGSTSLSRDLVHATRTKRRVPQHKALKPLFALELLCEGTGLGEEVHRSLDRQDRGSRVSDPAAEHSECGMAEDDPLESRLFNVWHREGTLSSWPLEHKLQDDAQELPQAIGPRRGEGLPPPSLAAMVEGMRLGPLPESRKIPVFCKFFVQGRCVKGELCPFSHAPAPLDEFGFKRPLMPLYRPPSFDPRQFEQEHGMDWSASSVEELQGQVLEFARDQHGCRLLQRFLDEQAPEAFPVIFGEIYEFLEELMVDPFGNYLCQKLVSCASLSQRILVIAKVAPKLVPISLNMHGTRVVQKMVEICTSAEEITAIGRAIGGSVIELIMDLNGNHVVQRCLHNFPSMDNQFIYDAAEADLVGIATHKHGCCVLQRCIDYATDKQRNQLIQVIIENALELVQDAYGSEFVFLQSHLSWLDYVVQYVLDLGDPLVSRKMMSSMLGHIANLAVQKFSSNVVEKCLQMADEDVREKIIEEIFADDRLPRLLQDPYANYCIQKALSVAKPQRFNELVAKIKPHVSALRNTSFGKRIQTKIVKKFPVLATTEPMGESRSSA